MDAVLCVGRAAGQPGESIEARAQPRPSQVTRRQQRNAIDPALLTNLMFCYCRLFCMVPDRKQLEKRMPSAGKALTRLELYNAVYRKVGRSRSESSALVELVLKEISDSVARGETVKLSSFGTFHVRQKGERMGRNPKTGVDVPISPRRVIVFKASAVMKKRINSDRQIVKQPSNENSQPAYTTGSYRNVR
jgi:integration host factor subunit alpha